MGILRRLFVLILSVSLVYSHVLSHDDKEESLEWPTEYHFVGETLDFDTTIKTEFEIWYSKKEERSRRDFFGGSTKEFYYGDFEYLYTVFTKTDDELDVKTECWKSDISGPMDFLPDASIFTNTGEKTEIFDKLVEIWEYTNEATETSSNEILYVHVTSNKVHIPVQHISKSYSLVNGELKQHVVTNYYNFEDTVALKDLKKKVRRCKKPNPDLTKNFEKLIEELSPDFAAHRDVAFESYTNHHNKNYQEHEKELRKRIFEVNWRKVREHNSKNLKYKLAINAFSDWTPNELKYLTGVVGAKETPEEAVPFPHTLEEINEIAKKLPKNFDLRLEGAVTAPKNQATCGSCWSFAAVAAVEGALARVSGGRLFDLSEQSLIDCAWGDGPQGCGGALIPDVWKYVVTNGIPTESAYGIYLGKDGICHLSNVTETQTISGFGEVTPRNADAMKVALYKYGPANVGIQVTDTMYSYSSGVFYDFHCDPKEPQPNHAVTVVGYGNRDGDDYWIIKNSWGESWGEDGYILMSAKNNNCFVLDQPFYAIP